MGTYGQKALHVHADDSSNCHFNCLHMSEARAARVQAEVKRRHKGHLICQLEHEASPQPELTLTAAPRPFKSPRVGPEQETTLPLIEFHD